MAFRSILLLFCYLKDDLSGIYHVPLLSCFHVAQPLGGTSKRLEGIEERSLILPSLALFLAVFSREVPLPQLLLSACFPLFPHTHSYKPCKRWYWFSSVGLFYYSFLVILLGFPRWLSDKESAWNAGDLGLIPGWRRSPGEGNGNPFQYSCLGNPMDRGAWWATVHGATKELDMT